MQSNHSRRIVRGAVIAAATVTLFTQQSWATQGLDRFDSVSNSSTKTLAQQWGELLSSTRSSAAGGDEGSISGHGASGDAVDNWTNAAGGAWGTGTNWSLGAAPGAADDAIFNLAGSYNVSGLAGQANTVQVNNGVVGFTGGSLQVLSTNNPGVGVIASNTPTGIAVGFTNGQTGRLNISGGTQINYTQAYAGGNPTAIGIIDVSGAGTVVAPDATTGAANGRFGVMAGNGTINVRDGAVVNARLFEFGRQDGSAGNRFKVAVNVTNGGKMNLANAGGQVVLSRGAFTDATMLVDGVGSQLNAQNIFIGGVNGTAAFTLSGGGVVTSQQLAFDGAATLNVSGAGSVYNSVNAFVGDLGAVTVINVNNGGSLIGGQDTFTGDGVNATLNMASGGQVTYDTFFSGSETSTNNISNVNLTGANTRMRIKSFVVTNGGSGTTGLGTTTINVLAGSTFSAGRMNFNQQSGLTGTDAKTIVNVNGAGSLLEIKDPTGDATSFVVLGSGANSTSELNVTNNGAVTVTDTIADPASPTGAMIAQLIVGSDINTVNNVNVNTGGDVTVQSSTFFGTVSGAVANVAINGVGSTFDGGGSTSFGGGGVSSPDFTPGGGTTNMTIAAGGSYVSDIMILARDPATALASGAKTNITVTGAGSKFVADGVDDPNTAAIDDGYFLTSVESLDTFDFPIPTSDFGIFATINLTAQAGGLIKANEAMFLGDTQDGSTTITVDGAGSTFDSARQMSVNTSGLTNSLVTFNITNGGVVKTSASTGNAAITAGSMFIGTDAAGGTTATAINISGTGSALTSTGSIFLGGIFDESDVETTGSPATVIAGAGTVISAAGSLDLASNSTMTTAGTVSVAGVSTIGGTWTASAGAPSAGTLNVVHAGVVKLTNPTAATATLLKTDNTLIASTAKVDIGKNAMRIRPEGVTPTDTNLTKVKAFLALGRVGPGTGGITSTALTANMAIGYKLVTTAGTFLGDTTAVGDILVRSTLKGDTDLNGAVSFDDLLTLAQAYNTVGTGEWYTGDSTFDGNVNFDDLLALAQNYGTNLITGATGETVTGTFAGDWNLALSMVPEPTSIAALGMGAALLGRRRK